jgi:serine/threonine-protein kinase
MSDEQRRTSLRHAGAIEFMAPEQNAGAMLFQTDVYSFGIILYELLAGSVPFPLKDKGETSRNQVMVSHLEKPPPDLLLLRKEHMPANWSLQKKEHEMNVPQWLVSTIYKCLQKRPQDRFQSGVELYDFICSNSTQPAANKTENTGEYLRLLQSENDKLLQEKQQLQKLLVQYQQGSNQQVNGTQQGEIASLRATIAERDRELQAVRTESNYGRYTTSKGVSKSSFYALLLLTIGLGALAAYGFLSKKGFGLTQSENKTSNSVNTPDVTQRSVIGQYKVDAEKAYFHNEPDPNTKRNAYLIPSEDAIINALEERNGFLYTEFTNTRGQTSKGWLRAQDLISLSEWTRRENTPKVLSAEEVNQQLQNAKDLVEQNNVEDALKIYKPLSQQKNAEAMYYYGDLALRNKNQDIDCATAVGLIQSASDKKFTPAKRTLGFLYLFAENRAVLQLNNYHHCEYKKDLLKGSKLLMEAVLQGDTAAKKMIDELKLPQQPSTTEEPTE